MRYVLAILAVLVFALPVLADPNIPPETLEPTPQQTLTADDMGQIFMILDKALANSGYEFRFLFNNLAWGESPDGTYRAFRFGDIVGDYLKAKANQPPEDKTLDE